MEFGVSMTAVARKVLARSKTRDLREAYLAMVGELAAFASGQGLTAVEIGATQPFDSKVLGGISGDVRKALSRFRVSFHLPHEDPNLDSFNSDVRKAALRETKAAIAVAKRMGARNVVLHPGFRDIVSPGMYALFGKDSRRNVERAVGGIAGFCRQAGVPLTVENMPSPDPFYTRPEEFRGLVELGAGITLDPAHAVFSGVDPVSFIRMFRGRIMEVHLQDALRAKHVEKLQLGTGDVDYAAILRALVRIDFKGPVILELDSEESVANSLRLLRKADYLQ